MLEHALDAPEAAAGDNRGLQPIGGGNIGDRRGNHHSLLRGARRRGDEGGNGQCADGGGAEREAAELASAHGWSFFGLEFRNWLQFKASGAALTIARNAFGQRKIRGRCPLVTRRRTRLRE